MVSTICCNRHVDATVRSCGRPATPCLLLAVLAQTNTFSVVQRLRVMKELVPQSPCGSGKSSAMCSASPGCVVTT